jgi:hypothetical protein
MFLRLYGHDAVCSIARMSHQRSSVLLVALLGAVLWFGSLAPGRAAALDRKTLRSMVRACRDEGRTCRRTCRADARSRRNRARCRRACRKTTAKCIRRARRGPRKARRRWSRCRTQRRACVKICFRRHGAGPGRRPCIEDCKAAFHKCR